jgi:transmembrane sensor
MERSPTSTDKACMEPTGEVVACAAEWMAHLESGDADEADLAAFEKWKAGDPSHALAIERMRRFGNGSEVERETLRRRYLGPRRRLGGTVLAVAMLASGAWLLSRLPMVELYLADERTVAGEMRERTLIDGSRIVLATDSAADFDDARGHRTVRLLRGELLAKVVKGQGVFRVETADGTAEALGTAFTVRKEKRESVVAVISSQVRACPASSDRTSCLTLSPGERARIADGRVTRLSNAEPGDMGAWAEGWLPANDMALTDLLDVLNRWRANPIRFDRQALSDLRVSGIFPLREGEGALANIARSQPVEIDRSDPRHPLIRRKAK